MPPHDRKVKSFRPPFSKGGAVEGAEPSSPSADGETSKWRFFLRAFSLRLFQQRKSGYEITLSLHGCAMQIEIRGKKNLYYL